MTLYPEGIFRHALVAFSLLAWSAGAWADIDPYSARYSIYRNGKLTGKAEVTFTQAGDNWHLKSRGTGTHGLAKVLGARDNEVASGHRVQGRLIPDEYSRHTQLAGIDQRWSANFDWKDKTVHIVDDDVKSSLPLAQPALDPLTLKLEIRRLLADNETGLKFWLVDEDEVSEQNFRRLRNERLETSLGCLDTIPVEKIRNNSKRYTRAWHAPDLAFVAVRIEHGKTGGDHMEMRITELVLENDEIIPRPGCAGMRNDPSDTAMTQP